MGVLGLEFDLEFAWDLPEAEGLDVVAEVVVEEEVAEVEEWEGEGGRNAISRTLSSLHYPCQTPFRV